MTDSFTHYKTMSVLTERPGVMTTSSVATGVVTSTQQPPPVISCTVSASLDTAAAETCSEVRDTTGERAQQPLCRSSSPRPSNGLTFARRRHSKSVESPYLSRPRMKRRGAVSYDSTDAAAEYIRYLG